MSLHKVQDRVQGGSKNYIINSTSCVAILYGYRRLAFYFTFHIWLTDQGWFSRWYFCKIKKAEIG